jgi:hypothetical protein
MPQNYDPDDANMCWPEGEYDAALIKVEDKTSKVKADGSGGNPMQVLTWRCYHDSGQEQLISDYIVFPNATFKLRQLAIALGKVDEFEARTFQADDNINCTVVAVLGIEKQDGYPDKNKIKKVKAGKGVGPAPSQLPPRRVIDPTAAKARAPGQRPESPFEGEPAFTSDEIPFAWEGSRHQPL